MAKLSKWVVFTRAFLMALVAAGPSQVTGQSRSEEAIWAEAVQADNIQGYHIYLSLHPDGLYVLEAVAALPRLGAFDGGSPNPQTRGGALQGGIY